MNRKNIEEKIISLLKNKHPLINTQIDSQTDLIRDLRFDSVSIMQIIIQLEEIFEIEFDEEFFDNNSFKIELISKYIWSRYENKETK